MFGKKCKHKGLINYYKGVNYLSNGKLTISKPQIVELDEIKLAGRSCSTTMEQKDVKIPNMVEAFHVGDIQNISNRINAPSSYGMYIDPPNWDPDKDEFTWVAAVEVSSLEELPLGLEGKVIPAGRYASLRYNPVEHKELEPYSYLYRWIKESGYEQVGDFGFEYYEPFAGVNTEYTLYFPIK